MALNVITRHILTAISDFKGINIYTRYHCCPVKGPDDHYKVKQLKQSWLSRTIQFIDNIVVRYRYDRDRLNTKRIHLVLYVILHQYI